MLVSLASAAASFWRFLSLLLFSPPLVLSGCACGCSLLSARMWAAESPSSALGLFLLRMLPIPGSDAPPAISAFALCPPWWCTLPELVSEVEVKEVEADVDVDVDVTCACTRAASSTCCFAA